jgi:O-antigen/teichoic acid export membrane protein
VFTVLLTLGVSVYYLRFCPQRYAVNPADPWLWFYQPQIGIGYYVLANAVASAAALLLLLPVWKGFSWQFDVALWKRVLRYSYPLIIVGFGGMINEMLSRLIYVHVLDLPLAEEKRQLGIFGASYKVAVLITIFIQVFRMAAEPFFFRQSTEANAPRTYARVMKFFVIACCLMWLAIGLGLEPIARLAFGDNYEAYKEGASIIPILAMGSVFLGIYYNLSIWYKLTNRTWAGAWITLATAVLTAVLNIWWIPRFGYYGSAWATFVCYLAMMLVSYYLGQRYYAVPYAWKKYTAYIVMAAGLYLMHARIVSSWAPSWWLRVTLALLLYGMYVALLARIERRELAKLPLIGRWFR